MANSSSNAEGGAVGGVILLVIIMAAVTCSIPGSSSYNIAQIASLFFMNGILVGWADNLATAFFFDGSSSAARDFRDAILTGERHYPITVLIWVIIGTFLSVGGVIAVLMARSASSSGEAFKLGFFAEIAEGVIYHIGYFVSTDRVGLTPEEFGLTFVAAIIMGFIAMGVHSGAKKYA